MLEDRVTIQSGTSCGNNMKESIQFKKGRFKVPCHIGKKQLSKKKVGNQGLSNRSVSQAIERKVSPSHQCRSVASNHVGAEKYDFQDMESSPSVLCSTGKASATSLWGHCNLCNVQHSSKSSGRKTEEIQGMGKLDVNYCGFARNRASELYFFTMPPCCSSPFFPSADNTENLLQGRSESQPVKKTFTKK